MMLRHTFFHAKFAAQACIARMERKMNELRIVGKNNNLGIIILRLVTTGYDFDYTLLRIHRTPELSSSQSNSFIEKAS